MDATEVVEAIKSIPEKKESLREAFEALQSSLSSLLATPSSSALIDLQWKWEWKDVEDHISSIETCIYHRFSTFTQQTTTTTTTDYDGDDHDGSSSKRKKKKKVNGLNAEQLKSVCINMDAKGLRSLLNPNLPNNNSRKDTNFLRKHIDFLLVIRDPLSLALRSFAPDPALLILNAMYGFNPNHRYPLKHGELLIARKTCSYLLEVLHPISLEFGIKPALRERALTLALEWKFKIPQDDMSMDTSTQALAFLRLLVAYGLTPAFEPDAVIEVFCSCIWRRRVDVNLIKNLGLADKAHGTPKYSEYKTHKLPFHPAFQLRVSKLDKKIQNARLLGGDHNIHRMLFPQTEPESLDTSRQMDVVIEPESLDLPQMNVVTGPTFLDTLPQMDVVNPVTTVPTINPSTPTYNPLPTPGTNPTPATTPVTNPDTTPTNPAANPTMGGAPVASSGQSWCVASPSASQTALQVGLDYACGYGGADCSAIQQGGSCFNPEMVRDHASYAYNSYYQKNPVPTSCDFSGTAMITNMDPSTSTCRYPSSSTSSASTPNMNNPSGPQTGFGSSPPSFGSSPPSVFGSSPPDYTDSSSSSVRMPSSSLLVICLPMSLVYIMMLRL